MPQSHESQARRLLQGLRHAANRIIGARLPSPDVKALLAIAVFCILGAPMSARAQNTICAEATACTVGLSTTSAATIVGIGATTMSRIHNRKVAQLDRYLRNNRVAVLAAAALGAGAAIEDLVELAGVLPAEAKRFAQALRRRRLALRTGFERTGESGYLDAVALVLAVAPPDEQK